MFYLIILVDTQRTVEICFVDLLKVFGNIFSHVFGSEQTANVTEAIWMVCTFTTPILFIILRHLGKNIVKVSKKIT